MTTISADPHILMMQATQTANTYYLAAIRDLPENVAPQIVAAYMQAASQDYTGSIKAKILEEGFTNIQAALKSLNFGLSPHTTSADADTIADATICIAEAIQKIASMIDLHNEELSNE